MQKYWFKRKRYGWGWVPSTKEGVIVLVVYVVLLASASQLIMEPAVETVDKHSLLFFLFASFLTFALFAVTLKKAPKPKWRWGKKNKDNRKEDW